ncbi:MAG: rhomboid family intramembrane serine protease [Pirellulales bacterium]
MGLYDRDYQRGGNYGQQPGFNLGGPRTMVTNLVIVTCVIYLAQLLSDNWVTNIFLLFDNWYREPWQAYRLVTYGFIHSPRDLWHIAMNMFVLWMFGREVEYRYGQREFLAFYLVAIVVAGLVWTIAEVPSEGVSVVLGASGGISAIVILYAMNFPHRMVLFMFFIPMPMWVLAVIVVGMDALGAVNRSGNVAFTAHLGGAMFGFLYYQWGWRLERWLPSRGFAKRFRPKPKLRVIDPGEVDATDSRVDEILKKIQEHGQDSLTRGERRILEQASREYQKRRK